mmetsp:Transcript_11212/g.16815  ORF Transcript_11212/g.16815 Transcript_11212/m.16815 type:complete len:221 (-) Transcript_11212:925-1587(-)
MPSTWQNFQQKKRQPAKRQRKHELPPRKKKLRHSKLVSHCNAARNVARAPRPHRAKMPSVRSAPARSVSDSRHKNPFFSTVVSKWRFHLSWWAKRFLLQSAGSLKRSASCLPQLASCSATINSAMQCTISTISRVMVLLSILAFHIGRKRVKPTESIWLSTWHVFLQRLPHSCLWSISFRKKHLGTTLKILIFAFSIKRQVMSMGDSKLMSKIRQSPKVL